MAWSPRARRFGRRVLQGLAYVAMDPWNPMSPKKIPEKTTCFTSVSHHLYVLVLLCETDTSESSSPIIGPTESCCRRSTYVPIHGRRRREPGALFGRGRTVGSSWGFSDE